MLPFMKRLTRETPSPATERLVERPATVDASELELSDADLEQVVGGLERAYVLEPELVLRSEIGSAERAG
jgi:hypothetical protein